MSFDADPRDDRERFQCDCGGDISRVDDHYECNACDFDSRYNQHCGELIIQASEFVVLHAKIKELEGQIERMKCCGNCEHGPEEKCSECCIRDLTSNVDRWRER